MSHAVVTDRIQAATYLAAVAVAGGEAKFVEVQGTAEGMAFSRDELDNLLALASHGLGHIFDAQRRVLSIEPAPRPLGR